MSWSIECYKHADGSQPVDEFLGVLARNHRKLYAFFMALVDVVKTQGHRLEPRYLTPCSGYAGMWDLFANKEGFTAHVFFGFSGKHIILLDGHVHSDESTRGVPKSCYERAFSYWEGFQMASRSLPSKGEPK